ARAIISVISNALNAVWAQVSKQLGRLGIMQDRGDAILASCRLGQEDRQFLNSIWRPRDLASPCDRPLQFRSVPSGESDQNRKGGLRAAQSQRSSVTPGCQMIQTLARPGSSMEFEGGVPPAGSPCSNG